MSQRIVIASGAVRAVGELNDTPCAAALAAALPLRSRASTWGDEVYFDTGVNCALEGGARDEMAVGELGYWPTGRALCAFFGPTPASDEAGAPRAASPVNVVGRIRDDPNVFRGIHSGDEIRVEAQT